MTTAREAIEVLSFGCRLNHAEGGVIETLARGAAVPVAIVNTCAVTAAAERDARRAIRRLKRERPDRAIVVTGCAAQRDPTMFTAMPEVDRVVGNSEKLKAATWREHATERVAITDIMKTRGTTIIDDDVPTRGTRGFVEIQHGCDHRCTFCTIPFARGPSRSQPLGAIVDRIKRFVGDGGAEVVLSGVDITAYGADLPGGPGLGHAVRRLLRAVPELPRLRLSSLDPAECDEALVAAFAAEERLMPHAHLSLQAGDDLILKRMKRRHDRASADRLVAALRRARSGIALGADLIAGFPTESDAAAARSRAMIDDLGLAFVHVFAFDPRPGTPASRMPQLPRSDVKTRAAELRRAADAALRRHLEQRIGSTIDVLVESDGRSGHDADFSPIEFAFPAPHGTIRRLRAVATDGRRLRGEPAP
jgi:threonylcarbamoyladenosine tRNA methylthiotransferase MtaB